MSRRTTSLGGMLDRMSGNTGTQEPVQETRNPVTISETPQSKEGTKKVTFDFPVDFARALKIHCAAEGISMRDYVLRAIRQYQTATEPVGNPSSSEEFHGTSGRQPLTRGV